MPLKALYDDKMVQLYIRGKPATGDLARPFKTAPSMFGELHSSSYTNTSWLYRCFKVVLLAQKPFVD